MSSAAARSSTDCTGGGSRRHRSRNTRSTRPVIRRSAGTGATPRRWSGVSSSDSSTSASGFPPVCDTSRALTSSDNSSPTWCRSSARAAVGSSPRSDISARPSGRNSRAAPSRTAKTMTTRSAPRRRAANTKASADAGSSQWASSTRHTTRRSSAAAVSRESVATPIRNGSTTGPSSSPKATRRARACGSGSTARSRASGRSNACSAAYANGASVSNPCVRRTQVSPSSSASASSSADLPTPGSPRTTTVAADPRCACSTRSRSRAHSRSRPYSTARTYPAAAATCPWPNPAH